MNKKIIALAILGIMPVHAANASMDDVLKRLEEIEKQRLEDQKTIAELKAIVQKLREAPANNNEKIQERLVKLEKKTQRQARSLRKKIDSQKEKLSIKGFASVYATKANVEGVTLQTGVSTDWGFSSDTIAGLQFDYSVSEDIDAVIQLTAKGHNNFNMEAEWAFLRFNINDQLNVRGGRMRLPWYMYSESIEVGYAYPWVRPPVEVYVASFTTYEGVDASYNQQLGSWSSNTQLYYGTARTDRADTDGVRGLAFTLDKDSLTFRASYNQLENVTVTGLPTGSDIDYISASARYDNGKWFALLEGAEADVGKNLPFLGNVAFSGTLAYQFEKWMPYFSMSKTYSEAKHEATALSPLQHISMESLTFGLRYSLNHQVSLKAEIADYDDFDNTFGNLVIGAEPELNPNLLQDLNNNGVRLLSIGFDAVF